MLDYKFKRKKIWEDEPYRPMMEVKKPFEMLSDLSNGHLQTLKGVTTELRNIEKIKKGELTSYSFGGSDACIVEVGKINCKIAYEFGEKETELPTADLIRLLKDWIMFLKQEQ